MQYKKINIQRSRNVMRHNINDILRICKEAGLNPTLGQANRILHKLSLLKGVKITKEIIIDTGWATNKHPVRPKHGSRW